MPDGEAIVRATAAPRPHLPDNAADRHLYAVSDQRQHTDDFEHLPADAALAYNLTKPDYVEILCGSLEKLPDAFADIDIAKQAHALGTPPSERATDEENPRADFASLPHADRRIVRAESLGLRIEAAARSRAPRRLITRG